MEITKWNKKGEKGQMVRVSKDEALTIITSLSEQLLNKSANSGRAEFFTVNDEYFSIAVQYKPERPHFVKGFRLNQPVKDKVTGEITFIHDWGYSSAFGQDIDRVWLGRPEDMGWVCRKFEEIETEFYQEN